MWYQCPQPPAPAEGSNLRYDWDGAPVDFGDSVTYRCASPGLWFSNDRDQESFSIRCREDGTFEEPDRWHTCIASRQDEILIF